MLIVIVSIYIPRLYRWIVSRDNFPFQFIQRFGGKHGQIRVQTEWLELVKIIRMQGMCDCQL